VPVDLDPLGVAAMTQAQRATLLRQVLDQHPHLAELVQMRQRPGVAIADVPDPSTG
jgi:hypothetical protein